MLLVQVYRSASYTVYTHHTIVSLSPVPSARPPADQIFIHTPVTTVSIVFEQNDPQLSSYGMCYDSSPKDTFSKILSSALIGYGIIHQILEDSESGEYRVDVVRYTTPSHSGLLKRRYFVDSPAISELRGQEVVYRANLSTMRSLELSAEGDDGGVTPFRCDGRVEAPDERVQNTGRSPPELAVAFEIASSTTSHWFKATAFNSEGTLANRRLHRMPEVFTGSKPSSPSLQANSDR